MAIQSTTVRIAFAPPAPLHISRPLSVVTLTRPLHTTLPRNAHASIIYKATHTGPTSTLPDASIGNGIAIATDDFEEAPVYDAQQSSATTTLPNTQPQDAPPAPKQTAAKHASSTNADSKAVAEGTQPALSTFRLSEATLQRLQENNITHATEVQAGTFNLIYDGKDVIAKSRTGTGKTLAFALPILERLALHAREDGPRGRKGPGCIILAPTRELAKQVAREMTNLAGPLRLSVECFYGGSSYGPQESALRKGLDIVVGTPGRIMDHMERGTLRLGDIQFAVLDEADEMLSMGFAQDVEHIFQSLPSKEERQVVLFSATVPTWVKGLAAKFQRKGVVTFDAVTSGSKASTTVRHCAVRVPEREDARAGLLADIIAVHSSTRPDGDEPEPDAKDMLGPSRAIVFTQTKREADELATSGALDGCGAAVLHGDVSQRQREVTLAQFRKGKFQVLVATDVAARGLDISGVDVVVQYRVPMDSESYIHRAGRTGRAGKSGTAVVMFSDREFGRLKVLERECRVKFVQEAAPAPELALEAAVDLAMANLPMVDDRVRKHLANRAEDIVRMGDEGTDTIASLLAMAGRRTTLEDRSVLSGENGMRTLLVRADDGSEVNSSLVMRFINDVGKKANHGRVDVGLIRSCRDGSAVVDVASEQAVRLLEQWTRMAEDMQEEDMMLSLELATGVPALKDERRRDGFRGRGGDRRRGDFGRQGMMGRGGGQRRGSWRDDRSERGGGGGYQQRNGHGRPSFGGRAGGGQRDRDNSSFRENSYGRSEFGRGGGRGGGGRGGGWRGGGWRGGSDRRAEGGERRAYSDGGDRRFSDGGDRRARGSDRHSDIGGRSRRTSQFLDDDF